MARRISTAQLRSQLQQIHSRQRQAINRYNQAVRQYNQKINSAVARYNREVRAHTARVRADRQRVVQALSTLRSRGTGTRYVRFRVSVDTLHQAYARLDHGFASVQGEPLQNELFDLSERENANSLDVMNALLTDEASAEGDPWGVRGGVRGEFGGGVPAGEWRGSSGTGGVRGRSPNSGSRKTRMGEALTRSPAADDEKRVREATYAGMPLGNREFVAGLEQRFGRRLTLRSPGPQPKTRAASP